MEQTVGPTSTAAGIPILNAVLSQTVENLLAQGVEPDVYFNGSLAINHPPEIGEYNRKLVEKYFHRIRNL